MAETKKMTLDEIMAMPADPGFERDQTPTAAPQEVMMFTARAHDRRSEMGDSYRPRDIVAALLDAESGDLRAQMNLFEKMEETDMALAGFMGTRRLAPSGIRSTIIEKSDNPDALKAAELVRDVIGDIPSWRGTIVDVADAIGKGLSLSEIDWVPGLDRVWVRSIRHIDPKRYMYERDDTKILIRIDDEDQDWLKGNADPTKPKAMAPPPWKVIAHHSKMRSGSPARAGVLRTVVLAFLIRNFLWKDWSTYTEVFGMPLRVGKYPAGTGTLEKNALLEAVRALGSDAAAIISQQTELEIVDSVQRGVEPYSALASAMRSEMALAVLGQEMTNTVGQNGARAMAQVQQMVRQDLLETDCEQIAESVRRDLFYPIVGYNLGWEIARLHTPNLKFHYEPLPDLKALIEIDRVLFAPKSKGGLALPITKQQLYMRYGVEPPPEDADPKDFLVQPEDEMPTGGEDPRRLRQRNQDGENHDSRAPEDRRTARTKGGSMAAEQK